MLKSKVLSLLEPYDPDAFGTPPADGGVLNPLTLAPSSYLVSISNSGLMSGSYDPDPGCVHRQRQQYRNAESFLPIPLPAGGTSITVVGVSKIGHVALNVVSNTGTTPYVATCSGTGC